MRSCKFSLDNIDDFRTQLNNLTDDIYSHSHDVENFHNQIDNILIQKRNRIEDIISRLQYKKSGLDSELSTAYQRRQALINQGQSKGNGEEGVAYRQMLEPQIDALTNRINSLESSIARLRDQIDQLERLISQIENSQRNINSSVSYLNSDYHQMINNLNYLESHAKTAYEAAKEFCEIGGGALSSDVHEIRNIDLLLAQSTQLFEIKNQLKLHRSDNKDGLKEYQNALTDNISFQIGERLQDIYEIYGQFLNNLDNYKDQIEDLYNALNRYYKSSDF